MPNVLTIDDVKTILDDALNDKLCVQAWLGYANVLFVGFGKTVMPPTPQGERHPSPPYELQIDYGDWWIDNEDSRIGFSQDPREQAQTDAQVLVGRRVTRWRFAEPLGALEICFEGGFRLAMAPYAEAKSSDSKQEAWVLRVPIYYYYMRWDGKVGKGRRDHYFLTPEEQTERDK